MTSGLGILVSGMIACDLHQGGATSAVLPQTLGLRNLGHDVYPALHLLQHDAAYDRRWLHRAQTFAQRSAKAGRGQSPKGIERLASCEFFARNVWVQPIADAVRLAKGLGF